MNLQIEYRTPFSMIVNTVILSEKLTVYEKIVYSVLCAYKNNQDGTCFPSHKTIAQKSNCSLRKVIEVINSLEQYGLIEKQHQFNTKGEHISNKYIVKSEGFKTEI